MKITTVGLDLAKNVFQVHAIDEAGDVVVRKALRRRRMMPFFGKLEPCLIGVEACGTSHFWARELRALGHEVKLMAPDQLIARKHTIFRRLRGRCDVMANRSDRGWGQPAKCPGHDSPQSR